ncbi:MAG: hypothetical protein KGJ43_01680 [Acidobacteriota bacterium]|nr:hypothetical protein [Acidobacteriota bacterium]
MRRMLVIVNPYATGASARVRERVLRTLARAFAVEAVDTRAPGHAIELAASAEAAGFDAVAAVGGDGTVNEAANGLLGERIAALPGAAWAGAPTRPGPVWPVQGGAVPAERPRLVAVGAGAADHGAAGAGRSSPETDEDEEDRPATPALACIPAGQANVLVRMLGIPQDAQSATQHLVALAAAGGRRVIDLGVVNGRGFTFASGVGVDASVTQAVDARPQLKARLGPWFYTWAALGVLARRWSEGAPRMSVRIPPAGGAETSGMLEGMTAVVQNGSPYTYFNRHPVELARRSSLHSGRLAGCVLHRARMRDVPALAHRALSRAGSIADHGAVSEFSGVGELSIHSRDGRALPLHVDGDYIGSTESARYGVLPGALRLIA